MFWIFMAASFAGGFAFKATGAFDKLMAKVSGK